MAIVWFIAFALAWLVTIYGVPAPNIRRLFPLGFVGGFLVSYILQYLVGPVWGFWAYRDMLLPLFGVPFVVPLAFLAEAIIFVNFLPRPPVNRAIYVAGFSALVAALDFITVVVGVKVHLAWNVGYTFLLYLGYHLILYAIYVLVEGTKARLT